jgi:hypothetical protein
MIFSIRGHASDFAGEENFMIIKRIRPSKYLTQIIESIAAHDYGDDVISLAFNAIEDGRHKAVATAYAGRSELADLYVGVGSEEHCALVLWHLVAKGEPSGCWDLSVDLDRIRQRSQMMKQLAVNEFYRRKWRNLDDIEVLAFDLRKTGDDFSVVPYATLTKKPRQLAA